MMLNHLRMTIFTDEGRARLSEEQSPDGTSDPLGGRANVLAVPDLESGSRVACKNQ